MGCQLAWCNIVILMLVFVMVIATLLTLAERKWSAMMQDRIGPNRARIDLPGLATASLGGMPHVATDALKMLTKEDFVPKARRTSSSSTWARSSPSRRCSRCSRWCPPGPTVNVFGQRVGTWWSATPDFGLLYIFAIASLAVYGTSLAGWASQQQVRAAGRRARQLADDLLRGRAGPVAGRHDDGLLHRAAAGADRRGQSALPVAATRQLRRLLDVGHPGLGHLPAAGGLHRSSSPRRSPRPSAPRSTCRRARARSSATSSSTRA